MSVMKRFPDQESCIAHLEKVRFGDDPFCPLCGVVGQCKRKREKRLVGRWNCHSCKSSFNVLSGTIFQGTHIQLPKWFLAIELMMNAKKSLSSPQLARDLDLTQPTALYMQKRIRAEMASKQGQILLNGIIEADETYVGGKPRKRNKRKDDKPSKRGRGTKKTAVVGAVARGGKVVARVATDLTGRGMVDFFQKCVDPLGSELITDEYGAYRAVDHWMRHHVVNHAQEFVRGRLHTNTIEGVWALLKRAWYGSHHNYSKAIAPLYIAETAYKYNARKDPQAFDTFIQGCFA